MGGGLAEIGRGRGLSKKWKGYIGSGKTNWMVRGGMKIKNKNRGEGGMGRRDLNIRKMGKDELRGSYNTDFCKCKVLKWLKI